MLQSRFKKELPFHLMILPAFVITFIYSYGPLFGIVIAFQNFIPAKGLFGKQEWVGLDNFILLSKMFYVLRALENTLYIAFFKMVLGLLVPIVFALLLNEVKNVYYKRSVQTLIYLPHFISWVILGGILIDVLSPSSGIVNQLLSFIGIKPIFFLGDNHWFPFTIITTHVWKEFGFGTIVYLGAITVIDPELYQSAMMDGANRFQQMWHITLPGMRMIIVLMAVLSLGNVLNAGFEQVFNLYSPIVYESGDILDTFIYRFGILEGRYSPATAVGLFKSLVSLIFISISYFSAYKLADYRIF